MRIEETTTKDGNMQVRCYEKVDGTEFEIVHFSEEQLRELMVWVKNTQPDMMQMIFCEECPEHVELAEHHAHCLQQTEEGGRCQKSH